MKACLKLLYSSTQTSADDLNGRCHVSRITVSLRNVRVFHARAAVTGKARSPRVARRVDGTCSSVVSWCQKSEGEDSDERRSLTSATPKVDHLMPWNIMPRLPVWPGRGIKTMLFTAQRWHNNNRRWSTQRRSRMQRVWRVYGWKPQPLA